MSSLIETEIGTISADWRVCTLEEVCEPPQYGYTASAEEKGSVRFLRITDITELGVNWGTVPFCNCPEKDLSKYHLAYGDIVFARIGATTGKSYLITDPPPSVFASYLIRVRPKKEIDSTYLSHFFRSKAYWQQIDSQKDTNLKKGVNGSLLKKLIVPVPPLPEQRKIAAVLGTFQKAIAQQERIIQTTTELKKTLMQKLFTEGLRGEPQKETEIGLVPESWDVVRLEKVCAFKSGGTPSRSNPEFWEDGSIPWVKTGEVDYCVIHDTEEKITATGLANSSATLFPSGTLLMAMYGQGITRGKVAILGVEAATNQACVAFFPRKVIRTKFLYFFFEYHYERIRNFGHGANQKNLSAEILKGVSIAFPENLEEQDSIIASIEALDQKQLVHCKKKALLTDTFRTLLHQLMTAQLRVNDIDTSIFAVVT